jgi:hypothetical protein
VHQGFSRKNKRKMAPRRRSRRLEGNIKMVLRKKGV